VVFVVRNPELASDDFGDARARPEFAPEVIRLSPVGKELREHPQLLRAQPRSGPEMGAGAQRLFTFSGGASHPPADRAFRHVEGLGDLLVRPAVVLESEGTPAAVFPPVRGAGVVRCHTRTLIT
jgi:hypothetical protein